jgi:hypothetical protein
VSIPQDLEASAGVRFAWLAVDCPMNAMKPTQPIPTTAPTATPEPERIAARAFARELTADELAHVAGGMTNWSTESAMQCDKEIAVYLPE